MLDLIYILLALVVVLGIFVWILVLPVFTYLRTRRIAGIIDRLERLERILARLQQEGANSLNPIQTETAIEPTSPVLDHHLRPRRRLPDGAVVELWIGRHALGWTAVLLLLIATAFFVKHAFESRWIGPLGRVSLGIVAGAMLCLAGLRSHQGGRRRFAQMLLAAGIVLLYLATFASFTYYHLLPQERAVIFLTILVAEAAALAISCEAMGIAIMALVGGLLTPFLLHSDRDQHRNLFIYLVILDFSALGLTLLRRWQAIPTLALLGTQALFWAWYDEHYHPEKLSAAFGFQVIVFGAFLAHQVLEPMVIGHRNNRDSLSLAFLNATLFSAAAYVLLNEDYHPWMGVGALGLAVIYSSLSFLLLQRQSANPWQVMTMGAIGLSFLAMVFPLQTDAAWIDLGLAVEGLVLWWFGFRIRVASLRVLGAVLLLLAVSRLVLADTPWAGREQFWPLLNRYALPSLGVALCILGAAVVAWRFRLHEGALDHWVRAALGLTGVGLVWLILSLETWQFFTSRRGLKWSDMIGLDQFARVSLSVLWAVYAAVVLGLGLRLSSQLLRRAGLGLFGLTLGKVIFSDLAELPGFYRIVAFFVLAVMMGVVAWGYQKIEGTRRTAEPEVTSHEKE